MQDRPTAEHQLRHASTAASVPFAAAAGLVGPVAVWGLSIPVTKLGASPRLAR